MEEFILKVRNNPCLWDNTSILFRDNARKYATWDAVATECGMADVTEAKALWKRLRDSHREAMRRRRTAPTLAPWKYEDLMDFLLPLNTNAEHSYHSEQEEAVYTSVSDEEDIKPNIESPYSPITNSHTEGPKRESFLDNLEGKEKRRAEQNRQRSEMRKQLVDSNRNGSPDDALNFLFSSLCQKTKMLPRHLQLRVQREIFESVTKAEEEALVFEDGSSSLRELEVEEKKPVIESVHSAQTKNSREKRSKELAKNVIQRLK